MLSQSFRKYSFTRKYPLGKAFSKVFVLSEHHCLCVDGRDKRIKKYSFTNEIMIIIIFNEETFSLKIIFKNDLRKRIYVDGASLG